MSKYSAVAYGYATQDYVLEMAEKFHGTGTKKIEQIPVSGWPRSGGAAIYASRQLVLAGIDAAPITWVGSDEAGMEYLSECNRLAITIDGVEKVASKSALCLLIYQPDGTYGCLFDPGPQGKEVLTKKQQDLIRCADLVVIAIGPPARTLQVLELIRPNATVAWIAKDDAEHYSPEVRGRCATRANFIFCNAGERVFVDEASRRPTVRRQVVFETRGSAGVLVDTGDSQFILDTMHIETSDTTGAGDTFAGATMAAILRGEKDLEAAAKSGIVAASKLLVERS